MLWWIARVHARSRRAAVWLSLTLAVSALDSAILIPVFNESGRLDRPFPLLVMAAAVIWGLLQGMAAVLLVTPPSWQYYKPRVVR
jgi:hypothetical protein